MASVGGIMASGVPRKTDAIDARSRAKMTPCNFRVQEAEVPERRAKAPRVRSSTLTIENWGNRSQKEKAKPETVSDMEII